MIDLCMYPYVMFWIDVTNMFVKNDVEQVQGQRKNQYTLFCLAWSKPKRGRLLNQSDRRLED